MAVRGKMDCLKKTELAVIGAGIAGLSAAVFAAGRGIKTAILNLEDKVLTVKFRTEKTDADKIRKAVSKLGYDADEVAADPEAYEKLPPCCKKGGHDPK